VTSHGPLRGELGLPAWAGIFDELARNRILYVTVSGGEPFCRPDLPDFMHLLASRPFQLRINTNATLVGRREAELLASLRPRLSDVMVGIEGPTAEVHDSVRGAGSFDAMMAGVSRMAESGIRPSFYCTVTPRNMGFLGAIADLALELGTSLSLNPFVRSGPRLSVEMELQTRQLREAIETARTLAAESPGRIGGALVQTWAILEDIRSGRVEPRTGHGHSCAGCAMRMIVLPDGWVSPCDHFPELRIGLLAGSTLGDVLTSPAAREFRERVEMPLESNPECAACEYLAVCPGGCPVVPWDREGPLGPDPLGCVRGLLGG
jgi:radical SAM protein with 4Fe4S-binding SPASM domain